MSDAVFLGVDVGTGSARAGLFDASGAMLASAKRDIRMWREAGDIVEQSSEDIWSAICASVEMRSLTSSLTAGAAISSPKSLRLRPPSLARAPTICRATSRTWSCARSVSASTPPA